MTKTGKKQEVGIGVLDATTVRMLNIPKDPYGNLKREDKALVQWIQAHYDLSEFTPMTAHHGPHSGMSWGERLLRSYRLGLLEDKAVTHAEAASR